jgi:signal transduction histidine kinase/ActR/RegA family two-component response regulator
VTTSPRSQPGNETARPPHRLLVVDDDPHVLEVINELFGSRGYELTSAASAAQAIQAIAHRPFDAVVADLNLRGDSGLDVLRTARRANPDVVVVLVTGYATVSTAIGALREGAYDYLTKPFDLYELSQVVDRGLEAKRLAGENRRLVQKLMRANEALVRHEEVLKRRVDQATGRLRRLYEVARDVTSELDMPATLQLIVESAAELTRADAGLLFFHQEATASLRCEITWGLGAAEALVKGRTTTSRALHRVAASRTGARLSDTDIVGDPTDRFLSRVAARAVLAVPLASKDKPIGVLAVVSRNADTFSADDLDLLTLFALQAANAIGNARVYQDLKEVEQLKSDFVATVSHELRTPLTAIKGSIDLLTRELAGSLEPAQVELLSICDTHCHRILSIVNDILDISRSEASSLSISLDRVDPAACIRTAVRDMETLAAESGIDIRMELEPDLGALRADELRLSQVLTNLISNAIKFSPQGTTVWVRGRRAPEGVEISVVDSGCGIREADLPRLFSRFTQLESGPKRRAGGTGLGLVISKAIVEAHGGRIWVESTEGAGSTFSFLIPGGGESLRLRGVRSDEPR